MAGPALRRLYEHTPIDFKLLIVDCNIPPRFRSEMEDAVAGHDDVEFIDAGGPLLSNACKVLVADASTTELTCMLENDLMVSDGWLEALIAAMEETHADVAVPRILEGWDEHYHDDGNIGDLDFRPGPNGTELHIDSLASPQELDVLDEPRLVTMTEAHCFLFRTSVLKSVQPFDSALTAREEVDVCLNLHKAGVSIVLQPSSRLVFIPPPPVHPDEQPYYLRKWDYEAVVRSHNYIHEKWGLTRFPTGYEVARTRVKRLSRLGWFGYRAVSRWQRAPFKALKTVRQLTLDRLRKPNRILIS